MYVHVYKLAPWCTALHVILQVDVPTIARCYEGWQLTLSGSGKIGFGVNVPNLITGVFIATGQDVASVESCCSQLSLSTLSPEEMSSIGECSLVK